MHMPLPAHFYQLLVFISLGLIAFRSLGLVIASVANTMQEGTILVQLFYFPMLLLSGATFPAEKFPKVMQDHPQLHPGDLPGSGHAKHHAERTEVWSRKRTWQRQP